MAELRLDNLVFKDVGDLKDNLLNPAKTYWNGKLIHVKDGKGHEGNVKLSDLFLLTGKIKEEEKGNDYKAVVKKLEEFGEDEKFGAELDAKLFAKIIPIDRKNPFYDSDLVVMMDGFKPIPLNGITKSEFDEISNLYAQIQLGKTKFKIQGDALFEKETLLSLRTLLTRPVGREIIKRALSVKDLQEIVIKSGAKTEVDIGKKEATISYNLDVNNRFEVKAVGEKVYREAIVPHFIFLGHELIHVLHEDMDMYLKKPPSLGKEFDDLEEQRTETGLLNKFEFIPVFEDDIVEPDEEDEDIFRYDLINENNLRSEFGYSYRTTHRGGKKAPLKIESETPSQEQIEYIGDVIGNGLQDDLDDLMKLNDFSQIHYKDSNLATAGVYFALAGDNLDAFKKLFPLMDVNDRKKMTIETALSDYHAEKIVLYLLDQPHELRRINKMSPSKKDAFIEFVIQNITYPTSLVQNEIINRLTRLSL